MGSEPVFSAAYQASRSRIKKLALLESAFQGCQSSKGKVRKLGLCAVIFLELLCASWAQDTPPAHPSSSAQPAKSMPGMDMTCETMALMPGMLTPEQMDLLRKAKGAEFDRLFLAGMIQHHNGALVMVKDLFDTAGAGQDADLFNFATDADNTQRAEIKIMQTMLEKNG